MFGLGILSLLHAAYSAAQRKYDLSFLETLCFLRFDV